MTNLTIVTNNAPRILKYGYELPAKLRADFDYMTEEELSSADFMVYKNQWYDLGEFMRVPENSELAKQGWQGYASDSFFSGVVIKYDGLANDRVIVGRYYS